MSDEINKRGTSAPHSNDPHRQPEANIETGTRRVDIVPLDRFKYKKKDNVSEKGGRVSGAASATHQKEKLSARRLNLNLISI